MQNLFLQWLFKSLQPVTSLEDYESRCELFLQHLKPDFFTRDWKLPSLQSSTGREYLRSALSNAIQTAGYKYGDALFVGAK